jgi:signal transduction histidine kinase
VSEQSGPRRGYLAVSAGFLLGAVVASAAAVLLDLAVPAGHRAATALEPGALAGIPGLALTIPGALLLARAPRHPVAWILCIAGLHWCLDGLAESWLAYATLRDPALPGASVAFWAYQRLGSALLLAVPLVLLLYPGGRLPTGKWRIAALISLAATALLPAALLFVPSDVAQAQAGALPAAFATLDLDLTTVPLTAAVWSPLLRFGYAALPLSLLVPLAVVARRYRRSTGQARARMRWLVWAAVVNALIMLATVVLPPPLSSAGLIVGVGLAGVALAVGIARPQLVDIERLLGSTLLYGALAATVILVDAAVLAAASMLLDRQLAERDAAVVALLIVMLGYGPLRHRLWLLIRRVALGRRDDPYGVVAGLAEQLERSDTPADQLLAVAGAVATAFRVPYVAVEVDRTGGGRLVAEHGVAPAATRALPITYRGDQVGRLVLPRGGALTALSARDEQLLGDMVRQAAAAARTSDLAEKLQRSREQIVTAREEERRRLRRDLHDGLGPSLGAVALRIDTARNLARTSPEQGDRLLRQARDDVTAALADVRRLVHDLRPPALDDVGLVGAVRQLADRLASPGLTIDVVGAPGLDSLPAAVEVAAYRIASEALANVAKHAAADACRVRLGVLDGELVVEVADDGIGIAPDAPSGVGLLSLRERAAELGGHCDIECPDERGTVVRARLPVDTPLEVVRG